MKHSKKNWKKYLFFFVLTIAICYGLGLTQGAFPNEWRYLFGKQADSVKLLTSDQRFIPLSALIEFEKTSGVRVEFKSIESYHLFQTEAHQSDLIIAPLSWVPETPQILPHEDELSRLLDKDFQSMKLRPQIFFPLFWRVSQQKDLSLWGFYSQKDSELHPETWKLMNYLLQDPDRLAGWVLRAGFSSTLESMNSRNDLSIELKPIHLRSFQISQLKLQEEK